MPIGLPSFQFQNIVTDEGLKEEILVVVDVPSGKMGLVIGKRGAYILAIKAEIFIGGAKVPPDKVFVIGPLRQLGKRKPL